MKIKQPKTGETESRVWSFGTINLEKRDNSPTVIWGYGAVFNSLSQNLGGFRENIEEGAFEGADMEDVVCLKNHDINMLLARNISKTLDLKVDGTGLRYEFENPGTTIGNDLIIEIERGDIYGSSFSFRVKDDYWEEDKEGRVVRTIKKFALVRDLGPVVFPAYQDTNIAKRSMDEYLKEKENGGYLLGKQARERKLRIYSHFI